VKVWVDPERCQGHTLCSMIAPDSFQLSDIDGSSSAIDEVVPADREDQVREAGFFISLMSRLVSSYPNWACQVIGSQSEIDAGTKQRFQELVAQTKKPGASTGRPVVLQNPPPGQDTRRR